MDGMHFQFAERQRAEVGPLADVHNGLAAGDKRYTKYLNQALGTLKAVGKLSDVPLSALQSTIGRHAARAVRCAVMVDTLRDQWTKLVANIGKDQTTFNPPSFPKMTEERIWFDPMAPQVTSDLQPCAAALAMIHSIIRHLLPP